MLDSFSAEFRDLFDLEGADARYVLLLFALVFTLDTVSIECRHAWVRRMVLKRDLQTKRMDFLDVAFNSPLHRLAQREQSRKVWAHSMCACMDSGSSGGESSGPSDEETSDEVEFKRGWGGAWHAHCSEEKRKGVRSFEPNLRRMGVRTKLEAGERLTAAGIPSESVGVSRYPLKCKLCLLNRLNVV